MKNTYITSLFVLSALLTSNTAFAESSSTPINRIGELKERIVDIKQQALDERMRLKAEMASTTLNIKNIRQEIKQDIRTATEIKIGKRLDAQKLKVTGPFEKAIQNLRDLIARIESRMTKMEANGADISNPKILLATAKTNVTIADTELINLANLLAENIPTVSTSTIKNAERRDLLQKIKIQSEKTKTAIRVAQKSIIDTVNSLKDVMLKNATNTREVVSTSTNNL